MIYFWFWSKLKLWANFSTGSWVYVWSLRPKFSTVDQYHTLKLCKNLKTSFSVDLCHCHELPKRAYFYGDALNSSTGVFSCSTERTFLLVSTTVNKIRDLFSVAPSTNIFWNEIWKHCHLKYKSIFLLLKPRRLSRWKNSFTIWNSSRRKLNVDLKWLHSKYRKMDKIKVSMKYQ